MKHKGNVQNILIDTVKKQKWLSAPCSRSPSPQYLRGDANQRGNNPPDRAKKQIRQAVKQYVRQIIQREALF